MSSDQEPQVARADIEAKLRQIANTAQTQAGETMSKPPLLAAAGAGGLALLAVTYFLGRRRGRLRSTVVEIRRA